MNDMIEELLDNYETICTYYEDICYKVEDVREMIATACKAQRNACARVYEDYGEADEIGYNKSKIKSAEITREDYE